MKQACDSLHNDLTGTGSRAEASPVVTCGLAFHVVWGSYEELVEVLSGPLWNVP